MRLPIALSFAASLLLAQFLALPAQAAYNAAPATYFNDCSPGDQPAYKLVIPYKGGSTLEVRLWGTAKDNLAGMQMLIMKADATQASASSDLYVCAGNSCQHADAQMRTGQYHAGASLDGELLLHLPEQDVLSVPFVATYVDVQSPCD